MKKEKCEHLWDCEEFNPHCHICGLLMRDDIKEEKHLDWEEELEKKDKDNFPSSYNWSREKWIDFIRNLLEKERDEFFKKEDKTHEIIYDITRLLEEKYGHDFHGILSEVYIDLSNIFKKYGK